MTGAVESVATPPPDLSIRAKPPSPKRLSRKVLLSGAIGIGGVIALALMVGLGDRPDRRAAHNEASAAASSPPESISSASGQYDVGDLPRANFQGDPLWGDPVTAENDVALAPPEGAGWAIPRGGEASASARVEPPDPQQLARTAPILFGGGANARSNGVRGVQPGANGDRLDMGLAPPRSRFELMAGSVIPAALVTELNSELSGRVIAQVTSPVYDSVSGLHLLIPQGSRLMGSYDTSVNYGDHRITLVWNRLMFPNGWSINLQGMEGADPSGAAGLRDRTDNHLDRLAGAIGLSAIVSVIANQSENDDEAGSLTQSVGEAAAQQAAQTGGRIVDRELGVRPTLRVRPGAPVRVLVTRDIQLRPYRGEARAP